MFGRLVNLTTFRYASTMRRSKAIVMDHIKRRAEDKLHNKKLLSCNNANFQLIGGDYQGFRPSLLVRSEGNCYLFNCYQGLQRYCFNTKIGLKKVESLFITNLEWDHVSGVYGLSLTLQSMGTPELCIYATEGINNLFEASRSFMNFDTGMKCSTKIVGGNVFQDSGIKIESVLLEKLVSTENQNDSDHLTKKSKNMAKLVAYACSLPDLPGQLDPNKCKELKVPIGNQLKLLKSGQDVTLPDGRIVKSVDVCSPIKRGLNFLILECPKQDDIECFVSNEKLSKIREAHESKSSQIDMVFHFTPEEVTNDSKYQDWMHSFPENCRHFLLYNTKGKRVNFVDSYRFQYLLQKLDSEIFPLLYLPTRMVEQLEEEKTCKRTTFADVEDVGNRVIEVCDLDTLDKVVKLDSLDKITVRPGRRLEKIDASIEIDLSHKEALLHPEYEKHLAKLRDVQRELPVPQDYEPEVVFLGTGSSQPGKLRNTSCILFNLNHPQKLSVIMDCGEDSYGQLYRFYGPEKLVDILKGLKLIYISHQHADHHVGLVEILRQRRRLTRDPIALLLPPGIESILQYHNENFEDLSGSYRIFLTSQMVERSDQLSSQLSGKALKLDLKMHLNGLLEDVTLVAVEHCVHACAVVFKFNIGHPNMRSFTVSYSGDARPSKEFARAGRNSDLLIHEATFDHRSYEQAVSKLHSTSTEAIQVAKQMNAKYTILTHFSLRFPKIPYFTEDFDETIGFAFDNMSLKCPSHFPRLPIMKEILTTAFKRSLDKLDQKYFRQLEQQLLSAK